MALVRPLGADRTSLRERFRAGCSSASAGASSGELVGLVGGVALQLVGLVTVRPLSGSRSSSSAPTRVRQARGLLSLAVQPVREAQERIVTSAERRRLFPIDRTCEGFGERTQGLGPTFTDRGAHRGEAHQEDVHRGTRGFAPLGRRSARSLDS